MVCIIGKRDFEIYLTCVYVVFDDALSIKKLDEQYWEVGVHVCDITYFIKAHSALDKEARARGVRVDLIHSHVPMIPEILTEEITNLSQDKSR